METKSVAARHGSHSFTFYAPSTKVITKPKTVTPLERCENVLVKKLLKLKALGVLKHSLIYDDVSNDFEILEFYGDSVLSERIAYYLMKTRRFLNPSMLTKLKVACVCNANLIKCYEKLGLDHAVVSTMKPQEKSKADVIEAILGELTEAMSSPSYSSYHHKISAVLEGLLTFISFTGEQTFHEEQAKSTITPKTQSPPRHASLPSPGKSVSPTKPKMAPRTHETSPTKRPSPPKRVTWTSNVVCELPEDNSVPLVVPPNFVPSSNCQKSILKPPSPPRHPPVYKPTTTTSVKTVKYVPTPVVAPLLDTAGIPKHSTWEELVAWSNSALVCS